MAQIPVQQRSSILFVRGNKDGDDAAGSANAAPDPYIAAAHDAGYAALTVPIIETSFENINALVALLENNASQFTGIVATSKRAVEAMTVAWRSVVNAGTADQWIKLPFYIVGASSKAFVEALGFVPLGYDSGNAEKLADFIIAHQKDQVGSASMQGSQRILFLRGDKTLGTVNTKLAAAGISVTEMEVYATRVSATVTMDLREAIMRLQRSIVASEAEQIPGGALWVAVFSPSGTPAVVAALRDLGVAARIASIGATSSAGLSRAGVVVDAQARAPTALELRTHAREMSDNWAPSDDSAPASSHPHTHAGLDADTDFDAGGDGRFDGEDADGATGVQAALPAHSPSTVLSITVSDPQKHGEGTSAFMNYLVTTKAAQPSLVNPNTE
ncbi:hypothetical protein HDU83_000502 [Entophlyctis luteolus]|nr:hypothetical protein HDU83_000502 [Entophlyctis luteolus]